MNIRALRMLEIIAQTLLGDGVTCILVPRRHMLLWRSALPWAWWHATVDWFASHTGITRALGVVETIIGAQLIIRASREQ